MAAGETNALMSERATPISPLQRYYDTFKWKGHSVNYRVEGPSDGDPVLLIHGFGASVNHWRKNFPALTECASLRVYAIDLLGFGGSDKPKPSAGETGVEYSLELWRDLVIDFVNAVGAPTKKWAFVGNSIGSLVSLMVVETLGEDRVRAAALMNCAGGLVSFRRSELNPFLAACLWLFNTALFNPFTGPILFQKFRTKENIASVLRQVYSTQAAVTDELLEILCEPAIDEGACDVFLAILNADAGPTPESLLPKITWCPTLVVWGENDSWTPLLKGSHPGASFWAVPSKLEERGGGSTVLQSERFATSGFVG